MGRVARVRLRRAARAAFLAAREGETHLLGTVLRKGGVETAALAALLRCQWFGEMWAIVDGRVPRARVAVDEAAGQTVVAERVRDGLLVEAGQVAIMA